MEHFYFKMGEGRILDAPGQTARRSMRGFNQWTTRVISIGASFVILSCTLPQVVVVDDPLTGREHLDLGLAYEQDAKLDLAEIHYLKARKKGEAATGLYLGNIYFSAGSFSKAERFYREAIRLIPDDPRAYNNLAWMLYLRKERLHEAEGLARKGLELAPFNQKAAYRDTLEKVISHRAFRSSPD